MKVSKKSFDISKVSDNLMTIFIAAVVVVEENQIAAQKTKQAQLAPALVPSTRFPILPLLRPILYLPFIEQQKKAKQNTKEA